MVKTLLQRKTTRDHMDAMWDLQQENSDICAVKRIFIVEDNSALRNLLWEILQDEMGYQINLAPSGKEALNMLQSVTPQLFLLDKCLSDMDGLELIERIWSIPAYEQIPILLMSEYPTEINITSKHLRYLPKPFGLNKLLKTVEEALSV